MTETTELVDRRATLHVTGATKTFNATRVLDGVSFTLRAGEICALIGQNGSGKSTLIKLLSGFHPADPGFGARMGSRDIGGALHGGASSTGMAFVHQDLALVPSMTILENLRINRFETGAAGRIRWDRERTTVTRALARVGLDVPPDRRLGDLSVTERALVAIARGLSELPEVDETGGQVLVLDEPTAYLPRSGVERLFEVLRALAAQGVSILFVSHRLDEVLEYCDRVLVLRNGELVADSPLVGHTGRSLVEAMIGERVEHLYPDRPDRSDASVTLEVADLGGRYCESVTFTAAVGEIVGFVGLPGNGYDEVPYLLAGATRAMRGRVTVDGRACDATALDPRRSLRLGIAMLPADRKGLAGAMTMTTQENMTLPTLSAFTSATRALRLRSERRTVAEKLVQYDVRPQRTDLSLALMSGGNQQKVMLAKWIMADPTVLALHEPTQGVDVGAKRDLFDHLVTLAANGTTVLISSVEYEDLAHLCDRVHVLRGGRIARTLTGRELTAHNVAAAVYE